jgi:hypothetical protein
MANSLVDRDVNYMKESWGTTSLVTDYRPLPKKVIQEVMYDPANNQKNDVQDLFETSEQDDLTYGVEPTYKIQNHQKILQE